MPDNFKLRDCTVQDLPQVHRLLIQLTDVAHGDSIPDLPAVQTLFAHMQHAPEVYFNLVAVVETNVVGFISVIFYKTLFHAGGTALINELVVDREQRGAGIGKALIEATVAEAKRRGMDEVEVGTETDNLSAREFYRRCGFDEEYVLLGMEF